MCNTIFKYRYICYNDKNYLYDISDSSGYLLPKVGYEVVKGSLEHNFDISFNKNQFIFIIDVSGDYPSKYYNFLYHFSLKDRRSLKLKNLLNENIR